MKKSAEKAPFPNLHNISNRFFYYVSLVDRSFLLEVSKMVSARCPPGFSMDKWNMLTAVSGKFRVSDIYKRKHGQILLDMLADILVDTKDYKSILTLV